MLESLCVDIYAQLTQAVSFVPSQFIMTSPFLLHHHFQGSLKSNLPLSQPQFHDHLQGMTEDSFTILGSWIFRIRRDKLEIFLATKIKVVERKTLLKRINSVNISKTQDFMN